jgi:hypothetical protein
VNAGVTEVSLHGAPPSQTPGVKTKLFSGGGDLESKRYSGAQ